MRYRFLKERTRPHTPKSYKDFTGACDLFALNSFMLRHALAVLVGVAVPFCLIKAQQTTAGSMEAGLALSHPETFRAIDSASLIRSLPMLGLVGMEPFSGSTQSGLIAMTWPNLFPAPPPSYVDDRKPNESADFKSVSPREVSPFRLTPEYVSGEVGVFYGRSTGKFGGDSFGSYIIGTTGNDKFQISVGASYQEWNGRVPRWVR
jgi:hypothetical protein